MRNELRLGCAVDAAMSVIEGKWKAVIICKLAHNGQMRFSELMRGIPTISSKVLANQLKELEEDGIIFRKSTIAAKRVTYSLTEKGYDLGPALVELVKWSLRNMSLKEANLNNTACINFELPSIKA
ncbi:MAG: helix-turn-helix transcriptional regulator [archaeon]|nr:helix-turn-helix transcriptional regulator [archaeon]